ncbi:BQ2448_3691 [Microbotryum intermedium]|uniref:BQ2448_3691 protein n=1 Tax=Microbotryum intermedium TaxID=269621 RepID=A0A238FDS6_9BASI|nr:BQ2448_3691 [Microbotryum intermedium]
MVLVDGVKFACQSCIKGHRSSKCTHTSRPLVEIKKKGRPTSQCSHCRDLRKTRSVHGKCNCVGKEFEEKPSKQVLPNGLSDLMKAREDEADASAEPVKGGAQSKPDRWGRIADASCPDIRRSDGVASCTVSRLLNPCNCRRGGKCSCCSVVDRSKRSRFSIDSTNSSSAPSPVASTSRSRSASRTRKPGGGGCCSSKTSTSAAASPITVSPATSAEAFSPASTAFNFSSPSVPVYTPFASTSYLPAAPTPLAQTFSSPFQFHSASSTGAPSVFAPTTDLGGCIGDDPTCTLLLAHLQANAPPPTDPSSTSSASTPAFSLPLDPWSSTPFAQSFIPHQTPLFLPHTQGTSACFCGDSCTCVGCPQHDPLGQKRAPAHNPGPGCGCRNRAAESAPPPLTLQTMQLQPSGKRVCCRVNTDAEVTSEVSSIDQLLQSVIDLASPCEITSSNQCAMTLPGLWNDGGNEAIAANLPGVNDVWSGLNISNDPWFDTSAKPETPQALPLFIAPEQRQKRKAKAQSVWALQPLPESGDPWSASQPTASSGSNTTISTDLFANPFERGEANGCSSMYAPAADDPLGLQTLNEDVDAEDLELGCGDECQCSSTCACRNMAVEDDDSPEGHWHDDFEPLSTPASGISTPLQMYAMPNGRPLTMTEESEVPTQQMAATSLGNKVDLGISFENIKAEEVERRATEGHRPADFLLSPFQASQDSLSPTNRTSQREDPALVEFVADGFC